MVSLQSSSLYEPTVFFWYTSPNCLVSIRLLSSGPSTTLYNSTAFLHIILKCSYPTGPNWWQSRDTLYRVDDTWCHSLSVSIESIALCVSFVLTHHCDCDNTRGWVVMMWLKDICLVVIGVVNVLAYDWWTIVHRHLTTSSSDISWPRYHDHFQRCNIHGVLDLTSK